MAICAGRHSFATVVDSDAVDVCHESFDIRNDRPIVAVVAVVVSFCYYS